MLCNTCKNKCICKHYEYFKSIILNIDIQINNCELYSSNNSNTTQTLYRNEERPSFRQPLPSTYVDPDDNASLSDEEDEERVYVNIDNLDNEPHSASIIDLFMKGDKNND